MSIKAVFFDRDGTLLSGDPDLRARNRDRIQGWSGKPFREPTREERDILSDRAGFPVGGHRSVEEEMAFWRRYYRELLLWAGVTGELEERAEELFQACWLKDLCLFPETRKVLDWFKAHGFRMGVISNTGPSLGLTLEAAGISGYFDCAVCSELIGARKPDEGIYRAALDALGVKAEESIYVDDQTKGVNGARALGMTAFLIDRSRPGDGEWRADSLWALVRHVEREG